jgi:hypothetical protein
MDEMWRTLKLKWESACAGYEAVWKSGTAGQPGVNGARRVKSATESALTKLMAVKQEIDQFVGEGENSGKSEGAEPFFVGVINLQNRDLGEQVSRSVREELVEASLHRRELGVLAGWP